MTYNVLSLYLFPLTVLITLEVVSNTILPLCATVVITFYSLRLSVSEVIPYPTHVTLFPSPAFKSGSTGNSRPSDISLPPSTSITDLIYGLDRCIQLGSITFSSITPVAITFPSHKSHDPQSGIGVNLYPYSYHYLRNTICSFFLLILVISKCALKVSFLAGTCM